MEKKPVDFDALGLKKLSTVASLRADYAEQLAEKKRPTVSTGRPEMRCGSCLW